MRLLHAFERPCNNRSNAMYTQKLRSTVVLMENGLTESGPRVCCQSFTFVFVYIFMFLSATFFPNTPTLCVSYIYRLHALRFVVFSLLGREMKMMVGEAQGDFFPGSIVKIDFGRLRASPVFIQILLLIYEMNETKA